MTAPLIINGMPVNLVVSTAGGATSLTMDAAHALGLEPHDTEPMRFLDASGYASHSYFYLKRVQLGSQVGQDMLVLATPDPVFGKSPHLDGVLAVDLMALYDVEIDFAKRRLIYYSPNHGPGHVIYWPAKVVGMAPISLISHGRDELSGDNPGRDNGYTVMYAQALFPAYVPARSDMLGIDVRTTVELDGKSFIANIDTGQEVSTLRRG